MYLDNFLIAYTRWFKRDVSFKEAYMLANAKNCLNTFSEKEIDLIIYGLKKGLDFNTYSKAGFHYNTMQEVICGLEEGIDVTLYAKPYFNQMQMREIRLGLEKGLEDVSIYAKN